MSDKPKKKKLSAKQIKSMQGRPSDFDRKTVKSAGVTMEKLQNTAAAMKANKKNARPSDFDKKSAKKKPPTARFPNVKKKAKKKRK